MSTYKGRALGTIGHIGCFSFHETKNYTAGGEGGATLINDRTLVERAEIIREKGTNRSQFFRGPVDKYTRRDIGSSYLMSDLQAAYLWAQLEAAERINQQRPPCGRTTMMRCCRWRAPGVSNCRRFRPTAGKTRTCSTLSCAISRIAADRSPAESRRRSSRYSITFPCTAARQANSSANSAVKTATPLRRASVWYACRCFTICLW